MLPSITLLRVPTSEDWQEVKRRALVTVGKTMITEPTPEWKRKMLRARHSPIRYLMYSFYLKGIPYWVSVHLVRHVHAQPYVKSQRSDRQCEYERGAAPQNTPVDMIWDINAEELLVIANKRLCAQASDETREVIAQMCDLVKSACPEMGDYLVPMCEYHGGVCHEYRGCGKCVQG